MNPTEAAFETHLCDWLITHGGYQAIKVGNAAGSGGDFDPVRGLDTAELFAFLGATQIDAWNELLKRLGDDPNAAQARFALTPDCELTLSAGPHRLRFGRAAHFDTARDGATRITLDAATGAVVRRAARDGYPWPWRPPV